MTDVRLVFIPQGLKELPNTEQTAAALHDSAEQIAKRVRVPSHLRIDTRYGVGPQGSFAQVQMFGPGAIAWEFGSRRSPAHAPLRKALR